MPRGDRTGPAGLGPMTGRAAGYCAGYAAPGYAHPAPGRGRGLGFGRGYGRGRGFGWRGAGYSYGNPFPPVPSVPAMTPQQEREMLKGQDKAMQEEMNAIHERIKALDSGSNS